MKKISSIILAIALIAACTAAVFGASTITISDVSATTTEVEISGTTSGVKAAVVVQVVDADSNILAMESFTVASDGSFVGILSGLTLTDGAEYTARVADYDGGAWVKETFTAEEPYVAPVVTYYSITVAEAENGSVSADLKTAASGKTVTLTVTPDKGWTLETITVTSQLGKELELTAKEIGTAYTFTMPSSNVTVKATFMEDNTMLNYFVDVKAEDYFYEPVLWAAQNGITSGTDETHFSPNASCTRAQMVTFLWNAAGCPEPTATECKFTDVSESAYYYKAVLWAVEKGITSGTGATTFSPNATCTRAQTVTFLWNAQEHPQSTSQSKFSDVTGSDYFYAPVQWAAENGITAGTGADTFSPEDDCTRAQIVTFLYKTLVK